jgi:hypothetical protein
MLKKLISNISTKKLKKNIDFFELPSKERERIIVKAAELSAQDQKDLLKEYEQKFGELQTNTCK